MIVRSKPERLDRAIKTETARAVAAMMKDAVEEGTGTAARIDGITVGGKTGTAETGIAGLNTTWFISYAGKNRPRGRDRGRRRAAELDRRRDRRAGRPGGLAGTSRVDGELLTCLFMASGDHLIDSLFDGRYLIIRKLGSGGMANVYLASDQELGRRVAIKILDDRHARDEQFVERFRREAQNAAGLSHPNIVSIYDRGEAEGTYYIAMEYVEGRTLKELLVARGPSPLGIAIDYTRQILSALRFAHRNGIVHRDIKPHNVIVDGEGRVKVMDFGIARAGAASQMTEAGSIIGTAQYLSPEQARGAPVDQTLRSLLDGDRALRAAHGRRPVQRRDPGRDRDEAPLAGARATLVAPPGDPARPRLRGPARAREGSGRPLPLGRGDGLGPRADRAGDRRLRGNGRGSDDGARWDR